MAAIKASFIFLFNGNEIFYKKIPYIFILLCHLVLGLISPSLLFISPVYPTKKKARFRMEDSYGDHDCQLNGINKRPEIEG